MSRKTFLAQLRPRHAADPAFETIRAGTVANSEARPLDQWMPFFVPERAQGRVWRRVAPMALAAREADQAARSVTSARTFTSSRQRPVTGDDPC